MIAQERLIEKLKATGARVFDDYGSVVYQKRGRTLTLERRPDCWQVNGVRFEDVRVEPNALIFTSDTDVPLCMWI